MYPQRQNWTADEFATHLLSCASIAEKVVGQLKLKDDNARQACFATVCIDAQRLGLRLVPEVEPKTTNGDKPKTEQSEEEVKQKYIARIENLAAKEVEAGGKPPALLKPYAEMTIKELENLGKQTSARINKLLNDKGATK